MLPSFYFKIDHLLPVLPRLERNEWRPSRQTNGHAVVGNQWPSSLACYFDGLRMQAGVGPYSIVGEGAPTQCYSLYKGVESQVWMVDHDVTQRTTGNGSDRDRPQSSARRSDNHDWKTLRFGRSSGTVGQLSIPCSYAGYTRERDHLQYQRRGSYPGWMIHLLPVSCHSGRTTMPCEIKPGLNGDVALLLGLLALAAPTATMKTDVPALLGRQWAWPMTNTYGTTIRGTLPKGVLVKVWLATRPAQDIGISDRQFAAINTEALLQLYQEGGFGPIIYER